MPGLDWLDSKHPIYLSHEAEWRREEKRLEGGEGILDELVQFAHETTENYDVRRKWARWYGFGKGHTTILAGHITSHMPTPNYAVMGDVRERGDIEGDPSLAEVFHYNCDGVGQDGQSLPAFVDSVEQWAMATRFRWIMAEMPSRETLKAIRIRLGTQDPDAEMSDRPTTEEEVRAGFRCFWVPFSPLSVTNWKVREGVLCWAIIRIDVETTLDFSGEKILGSGYYLLVRQGYEGLGPDYRGGGWWKYDAAKKEIGRGTWDDTLGQIPLWLHIGEPGRGTYERPSIGQSSTMELGQISADLMNAQSEQRFNARQASKSVNFGLGMDPTSHQAVITQLGDGSIFVAVPGSQNPDGTYNVPTIWNSSEGALATEVYATIIESGVAAAKEIMVRQIMAAPDASGARVEAEHASATVPMLARLAGTAEQSINTGLYFTGLRMGLTNEQALALNVTLPREYKLRDVMEDIDKMLATIRESGVRSPTWERALVAQKGDELDLLPEDDRATIEAELEEGADVASRLQLVKLRAEAMSALVSAGALETEAAVEVGYSPADAERLFGIREQESQEEEDDGERDLREPRRREVA